MQSIVTRIDRSLAAMTELTIACLLLVVPLVWDINTLYPTGPASKNLFLAYGSAVALAFAGLRVLLSGREIYIRPAQLAWILFGTYLLARALFDPRPDYALGIASPHLGGITVALILSYAFRDRGCLRRLGTALAFAAFLAVLYAVSQILDYDLLFRLVYRREGTWYHPAFEKERAVVFSTFGNPNYFAHFLGPVILLTGGLALAAANRAWRAALWSAMGVMLVVVFRTYNRGIWLGLLTGTTVWIACLAVRYTRGSEGRPVLSSLFRPRYFLLLLAIAGCVLALLIWLPAFEPLVRRFRAGLLLRDTSVRSRLLFWLVALLMWRGHPWLGIGMGRYDPRFFDTLLDLAQGPHGDTLRDLTPKMVSLRAVYAHGDYMQFLAEWGLVGFALFVLAVLLVLAAAVRVVRRDLLQPAGTIWPSVGLCAAFCSFLIQLGYDFPLHLPASELLFFFVAGCILVFERESSNAPRPWRTSNRLLCVLAGCVLLVPYGWSLARLPAKLSASHHLYHGQNNARVGENEIADREYENAARLDPENGEIAFCRAVNFAEMDRIPRALDHYTFSVETHQTSAYYYYLGIAYIARGDWSRAKECLEKLSLINPRLQGANYGLGLCYYRDPFRPDWSRAADYFAREVDQYPDDPKSLNAWLYLGECKWKLNDVYGARDAFHNALKLHDRNIQANERLGDIYSANSPLVDPRVALEYYQRAFVIAGERGLDQKVAELVNKIKAIQQRLPQE